MHLIDQPYDAIDYETEIVYLTQTQLISIGSVISQLPLAAWRVSLGHNDRDRLSKESWLFQWYARKR